MARVLVTGANSGIGLATVIELSRRGHEVAGTARSDAKATTIADALREQGLTAETVLLDVTDAAQCEAVVATAGPFDALVNNAGFGRPHAVEQTTDDEARAMLETMLVAPMRLARLALPGMRERGGGTIVNVSSIYGRATTPLNGWYQASKHGLEAVSDALRVEVASDGIRVVLVEPGGIRTNIWDDVDAAATGAEGTRYETAFGRSRSMTRRWQLLMREADDVSRVIADAIEARRPKPRYLVGLDARAIALLEPLTPDSVLDELQRRFLGL